MRFPTEFRLIAAFMAGATALAVAAWLVVANGESYVDSVTRLDVLRQAHDETSQLSSTTTPGVGGATPGVGGATAVSYTHLTLPTKA